jgi:hypothetical protein
MSHHSLLFSFLGYAYLRNNKAISPQIKEVNAIVINTDVSRTLFSASDTAPKMQKKTAQVSWWESVVSAVSPLFPSFSALFRRKRHSKIANKAETIAAITASSSIEISSVAFICFYSPSSNLLGFLSDSDKMIEPLFHITIGLANDDLSKSRSNY